MRRIRAGCVACGRLETTALPATVRPLDAAIRRLRRPQWRATISRAVLLTAPRHWTAWFPHRPLACRACTLTISRPPRLLGRSLPSVLGASFGARPSTRLPPHGRSVRRTGRAEIQWVPQPTEIIALVTGLGTALLLRPAC